MQIIKPTKKQVFNALKDVGCCWLGGNGCECYTRQLYNCYQNEEKRLAKIIYTPEEVEKEKKHHADTMQSIYEALKIFD